MRILVIGGGSIGQRYAAYAAEIAGAAALLDTDSTKAAAFEKNGPAFTDLNSALDWKPEGVIIATPHKTHIPLATKVAHAGLPVLIEKPLAPDNAEVDVFLKLLDKTGTRAYTVSNMRFHPAVKALRDHMARIGTIFFARAHFGNWLPGMRPGIDYRELYCAHKDQGGGLILDGIHEIDYLLWLLGPCHTVTATAARHGELEIDVEDRASLILHHESGAASEIHMDYLQQCKRRGCEIVGREGTLIWTSEGKNPESCCVRLFLRDKGWEYLYVSENLDNTQPYKDMIRAFVHAMRSPQDDTPLATACEGLAALNVALAVYKSIEQKKQIDTPS